jgi:hypothetical protein
MKKAMCFALALLAAMPLSARLTETVKVRYETDSGTSSWYSRNVTFLTGSELADLTGSNSYAMLKNYAVIVWGKSDSGELQASVIRLDSPIMVCAQTFDSNCLPVMGKMRGPDQEGRVWEICSGFVC